MLTQLEALKRACCVVWHQSVEYVAKFGDELSVGTEVAQPSYFTEQIGKQK